MSWARDDWTQERMQQMIGGRAASAGCHRCLYPLPGIEIKLSDELPALPPAALESARWPVERWS